MREKLGALIQFLAVVAMFILIWWGVGGAYQEYFGREIINVAKLTVHLVAIAVGFGVGVVGIIGGNLLKR